MEVGVVQAMRMTGRVVQCKVRYLSVASAEEAEALAIRMLVVTAPSAVVAALSSTDL